MSCSLQVQLGFLLSCLIWKISSQCSTDQFACLDGSKCIPVIWLCDGARDCPDGSDEKHSKCHPHLNNITCFGNQPECRQGGVARCIPNEWLCDGHKDCDNGEDEANCNGNAGVTGNDACGPGKHSCGGKCVPLNQRCEDLQSFSYTSTKVILNTSTPKDTIFTTTMTEIFIPTASTAKDIAPIKTTARNIFATATTTKYTMKPAGKIIKTTSTSKSAPSQSTTRRTNPKSTLMKVEHSPNEAKEQKSPQPIVPIVSYGGNDRLPDIQLYNLKSLRINKTDEVPHPTLMPEMKSSEPDEQATTVTNPSSESEQSKKVMTNNLSLTNLAKVFRTQFPDFEEPVDVRRAPEKPVNPAKRQANPSAEDKTREEIIYDLAEEKQPELKMEKPEEAKKKLNAVQEPIKPAPNPVRSIVVDPIRPVNA